MEVEKKVVEDSVDILTIIQVTPNDRMGESVKKLGSDSHPVYLSDVFPTIPPIFLVSIILDRTKLETLL